MHGSQGDMFEQFERRRVAEQLQIDAPNEAPANCKHSIYKAQIIEHLREGEKSCHFIDRCTPARGQALIHSLREEGHLINTISMEGVRHYRYLGYEKAVKVKRRMQEAYYATGHWSEVSRLRKELDGFCCQQCRSTGELETHHWVYDLFNEHVQTELITLCRSCHQSVHFWIKGGACHFPRSVPLSIAMQLGWEESA